MVDISDYLGKSVSQITAAKSIFDYGVKRDSDVSGRITTASTVDTSEYKTEYTVSELQAYIDAAESALTNEIAYYDDVISSLESQLRVLDDMITTLTNTLPDIGVSSKRTVVQQSSAESPVVVIGKSISESKKTSSGWGS
jgi:hypothetical protein